VSDPSNQNMIKFPWRNIQNFTDSDYPPSLIAMNENRDSPTGPHIYMAAERIFENVESKCRMPPKLAIKSHVGAMGHVPSADAGR
jgi:hypothetical protein